MINKNEGETHKKQAIMGREGDEFTYLKLLGFSLEVLSVLEAQDAVVDALNDTGQNFAILEGR